MDALIAEYQWIALGAFSGWFLLILNACWAMTIRRKETVWPWTFIAERSNRAVATVAATVIGCLGLDYYDALNPFTASLAGAASETTAELLRAVTKADFVRAMIEKRTGVDLPDSDAGSLNDTTIIRPPCDDTTERRP